MSLVINCMREVTLNSPCDQVKQMDYYTPEKQGAYEIHRNRKRVNNSEEMARWETLL